MTRRPAGAWAVRWGCGGRALLGAIRALKAQGLIRSWHPSAASAARRWCVCARSWSTPGGGDGVASRAACRCGYGLQLEGH